MSNNLNYAFVDRRCSNCNGTGCGDCNYTGSTGSYEEVPPLPERLDTVWAKHFRKWRERNKLSLRYVSEQCGISVPMLSSIEMGWIKPTEMEAEMLLQLVLCRG